MDVKPSDMDAGTIERHLRAAGNRALKAGTFWAMLLGFTGAVLVPAMMAAGAAENLEGPAAFSALATVCCAGIYLLARKELVHGAVAWAVFLAFASLPTVFFLAVHLFAPSGAAAFITGPLTYLYFVILVVSGFLFDFRLSAACGVVAGAGYFAAYLLARPGLQSVAGGDPLLLQDLTNPPIWALKSVMMAFGGATVGALAVVARGLVARVLSEEREKQGISRLFGQYVSEEVKDKILSDPGVRRGERKAVAVLFADVRGFSTFSEKAEPEAIVRRLNAYFDAMVGAIVRNGGVVDKFIGDGIMAVFGGVVALENPAEAALLAARDMRAALKRLNAAWAAEGLEPFENGIGIHFGEVLQGSIGSEVRREYTAIGDVVNIASRVEGLTKEIKVPVAVTLDVHRLLPEALRACGKPMGALKVKGRNAAVEVFGIADPECD
jgi:adenylate cyclase